MALDRYPIDPKEAEKLELYNLIFLMIFTSEMCIKIAGLGFKIYIKDSFNLFDAFIVVISIIEVSFTSGDNSSYSVFRIFRLFRVFKIAKSWQRL
jgi:hypothetical protein